MPILDKVMVLDMSHALAGPFCGMLLADFGANVIKVEHPHGDHFRPLLGGAYHAAINRNKRDISLDLKQTQAKAVVKKLMLKSDVLIESFTPGTMDRLGLGYEVANEINPKIIYCSISGFGQTGPYRELPGYDVVAQAMCGIMMCTGHEGTPPVRVGASWVDMGAGMYTAMAVLKALLERQENGGGAHIDVSLMDTALSWMSPLIARYTLSQELPKRAGSALAAFSPYQVFQAKDGYLFIGASTDRFWQMLCEVLELEHLVKDHRFAKNEDRVKNREALTILIEKALAKFNRNEVTEKLRKMGIPCGPVFDVSQALEDPHIKERGVLHHWQHPQLGPVTQIKTPIMTEGQMPKIKIPAPAIGQDTCKILTELGYDQKEIKEMLDSKAAIQAK